MMTEAQEEFFKSLCAPFPPEQVRSIAKSGRTLSYITSRMLFNRLDDVAGPDGWFPTYRMNADGLTCALNIKVPVADGEFLWMFKEDGGGFAGMSSDEDNEKSGYSDAVKRAGACWGIGRYLYRDGVPAYLGEQEPPPLPVQQPAPQRPQQQPAQQRPPQRPGTPVQRPSPQQTSRPPQQGNYDNFKPPTKPGKGPYAWLMNLEKVFGGGLVKRAASLAASFGMKERTDAWDEYELETVSWALIDEIKTYDNYSGQFDHLEDPRPPEA